ncbi:MAG: CAP domain-containing protein, partial [Candidatus Micrarchaeaceae archaeon]
LLLLYVMQKVNFTGTRLYQNTSTPSTTANLSYTTTTTQQYMPRNEAVSYVLGLINADRAKYGLSPVSLSSEPSAQQHAESMLQNNYFSHWDIYGMKPYMRYTLLGGKGAVDENIAYIYNSSGINVTKALAQMEYNFMYNDFACCNDSHRKNILTPQHNQVSIGVAYNSTTIYLVEDFINDYISWQPGSPGINSAGQVSLNGATTAYNVSEVLISYEKPVMNLTRQQLMSSPYNFSYSYPENIAGIGYSKGGVHYYYKGIDTINATVYAQQGNKFDIQFNISQLIRQEGPGEYTVMVALSNSTPNSTFIGSTYTFFIGANGLPFKPANV